MVQRGLRFLKRFISVSPILENTKNTIQIKNLIPEHNEIDERYFDYVRNSVLYQKFTFPSIIKNLDKIKGQIFAEFGCGDSPIGIQVAKKGAQKVYAIDYDQNILKYLENKVTKLGLSKSFELVQANVFDNNLQIPEKVDVALIVQLITSIIRNQQQLADLFRKLKTCLKPQGQIIICDSAFYQCEVDQTKCVAKQNPIKPYDIYSFFFLNTELTCYNIPSDCVINALKEAGYQKIKLRRPKPTKGYESNQQIIDYLNSKDFDEYIIKAQVEG